MRRFIFFGSLIKSSKFFLLLIFIYNSIFNKILYDKQNHVKSACKFNELRGSYNLKSSIYKISHLKLYLHQFHFAPSPMNSSKLIAKKSKKRKASDDLSSDEYEQKRTGKLRKASKAAKKQTEQRKKSDKLDKYGLDISSQSDSFPEQAKRNKVNYIPLQVFNADKIFTQILNKASKEPDFLIMLKNLLSGCSRALADKKNMFKKKWKQLRNSNCSQEEYLSRQAELKRSEYEEIHESEKDIMTKLSYANIKGFETRNSLIENYKKELGLTSNAQGSLEEPSEYEIQDQTWEKYYEQQRRLLDLLMKENDFVSQDYTPSNLIKTYSENIKDKQHAMKEQMFQDNQLGLKFNNIETEENPEATQFLFCKHFKDVNYDKVFSNGANSFRLQSDEKFYIEPKAMSWLLELKSDQIYQNDTFQKETYRKYSNVLKSIYQAPEKYSDAEIISNLLQVGAYILNAVHYYQKFKLKCDLLHPLDLLLAIERVKKHRRRSHLSNGSSEMIDQKYERIEKEALNINKIYEEMTPQN